MSTAHCNLSKDTVEKRTDYHLEEYIRSIVGAPSAGYDLDIIKRPIFGFKMTIDVQDPNVRIKHFVTDFFDGLQSVGSENFRVDNLSGQWRYYCQKWSRTRCESP